MAGRLVQIGRELGEYLVFQLLFALWARRYGYHGRFGGMTAKELSDEPVERFPDVVLRQNRKERTYLNHVLARSEVDSSYPTSRRLWRRERMGHYVPNPELSLKVVAADGTLEWRNVLQVLNLEWSERHLAPRASGRLWLPSNGGTVQDRTG
ncbi:MAG: hypothetical protein M3Y59_23880 [Myxococcota bacterium]|nr:hypothetical protein [Myxococcota bacterium]